MSKIPHKDEFLNEVFYVAQKEGQWAVTSATISLGHPVTGEDLESLKTKLRKELAKGTKISLFPDCAPKIWFKRQEL